MSAIGYALAQAQRKRNEPKLDIEFDKEQFLIVPALWTLQWTIKNKGRTTAQGVKLTLHLISPDTPEEKMYTIFDNLDIVSERKHMEIPVVVAMNYEQGTDRFFLIAFSKGFRVDARKKENLTRFDIARDEQGGLAGTYVATFQFSGQNLRDEDRASRRYDISFDDGLPDVQMVQSIPTKRL